MSEGAINMAEDNTIPSQTKRDRILTEKGRELFEATRNEYLTKLDHSWKAVEELLPDLKNGTFDLLQLRQQERQLVKCYDEFKHHSVEFLAYLNRLNTRESQVEINIHGQLIQAHDKIIEQTKGMLDIQIQTLLETLSQRSASSKHKTNKSHSSHQSSNSSIIARKRAQADAARTRLEFAAQEINMRKQHAVLDEQTTKATATAQRQKTELEIDLDFLRQQTEAAVAQAEFRAFEDDNGSRYSHQAEAIHQIPEQRTHDRTQQYVMGMQDFTPQLHQVENTEPKIGFPDFDLNATNFHVFEPRERHNIPYQFPHQTGFSDQRFNHPPNPPPLIRAENNTATGASALTSEITRFLLKKELLLSRLTVYNDQPETYNIWKATFLSIVQELNITPIEELDLLVKYLGSESAKHVLSIRTSNANNPSRGLERIWQRMDERFGSPEIVESALKKKLNDFPKLSNKDTKKLYELADILSEIEAAKEDQQYQPLLAYFDSSTGINPIVRKLPYGIQEKWTSEALKYKKKHKVSFPPFTFFTNFIHDLSKAKNDPSFAYDVTPSDIPLPKDTRGGRKVAISTRKTEVSQPDKVKPISPDKTCPLHHTSHSLNDCKTFRAKPIQERNDFLKFNKICFKCCTSNEHMGRACKETVKCGVCQNEKHPTAMHIYPNQWKTSPFVPTSTLGEEQRTTNDSTSVRTNCIQICGQGFNGKSCAKTVLVNVYPEGHPEQSHKMYALLDDQSNMSLAKSKFFDLLNIDGIDIPYTLSSCAGSVETYGRRATGCIIEAIDHSDRLKLKTLIECNDIPNIRSEIPTPEVAHHYLHLNDISRHIPPLAEDAEILLLIGRDLLEAHHIQDQRIGPPNTPYAQKSRLGWVIVGEACLGNIHKPDVVNVKKTYLLHNGRPSLFQPCPNKFDAKEMLRETNDISDCNKDHFGDTVFTRTLDDDKIGMSMEDKEFLQIMDKEFHKNSQGKWMAPLPFRSTRTKLPNNRPQAVKRAKTLDKSLQKDPNKKQHFRNFMQCIFDHGHAEVAPPLNSNEECWYLPIFGVYHPKKPDQIRGVFDSSAQYQGISLNNVLLSGPDSTNSLLGILLRFRKEPIAITADVEQMFYNFMVTEDHRNFLRFLWYRDNDMDQELIEYRMTVHVFGNSSSPAVATYGLRRTAQIGEQEFGNDVTEYVHRNFYVDDGLTSLPTSEEAIDLMTRTQQALLSGGNIRLHKIASNSTQVMNAFPLEDRAKNVKDLDFNTDIPPLQRSLGLIWNLAEDVFTFRVSNEPRPFTKRGLLSTVNSLFDPLGLVAPVVITGKIILREAMSTTSDWDEPLPVEYHQEWDNWNASLKALEELCIPRTYASTSLTYMTKKEIHVFSDASEKAIAAVAYLKTVNTQGKEQLGFILGKSKVSPPHGHTIPRLELCAAVLAVEVAQAACDQLDFTPHSLQFYTDSRIVLGYIYNQSRRFYIYVTNRVERIRKFTRPEQWHYVSSGENPADLGTRGLPTTHIGESAWLMGPQHLLNSHQEDINNGFPLLDADEDKELRPRVATLKINTTTNISIGTDRFNRFSSWKNLVRTIANLKHIACSFQKDKLCKGWHICPEARTVKLHTDAEHFLIRLVQQEVFKEEMNCLKSGKPLPKTSPLLTLNPIFDTEGLLRVGGRLTQSDLNDQEKHPLIIPGRHHLATLLVRHHHSKIKHQGRHFTEGAIRAAGLWIIGGKRLISSILHKCTKCRKLRRTQEIQKMADLPADRLKPGPAFSYVGLDTFGPWTIVSRRTRGGQANAKRWAILFTCMTTRAIHIEVVEDMGSSSFINALRRMIALRGKVTEFRSDRGTNFVGATDDLHIDTINVEDSIVKDFLFNEGVVWRFNPPHSSHMGGVWERLIGVTRRILDSMLTDISPNHLTHEVLTTLMAEVCAIINARPIIPVSSDSECPQILSPSTLLTMKTNHITEPFTEWNIKDLYKAQWRRVQAMADMFWKRWRQEYLSTLQSRRKWHDDQPNLKQGDVILLKEKSAHRNDWPMGIVDNPIPGTDNRVRKVSVRIFKDGKTIVYVRPITDIVLLLSPNSPDK